MKKMKPLFAGIVFLTIVFAFMTCKDHISDSGNVDVVFPDTGVSYGRHVQVLFWQACAFGGCHGDDTFDGRGFALDSYQHATAKSGIIIPCVPHQPCNPEASILVLRIEGLGGMVRMPFNRTPLNDNQINGIKTWIREGALNN